MGATKQLYRYQAALGDIYYPNNPNRGNCVGVPLNPDGSCTFVGVLAPYGNPTTEINNYSGLLGAWYRRGSALRANINAKFGGADNWIYRIDPLRSFNINANVSYAPQSWLTLSGNLLLQHAKNYDSDLAYNQHNYSVLVDASIMPNPRWGFDLAYNFDALQQNANVCFASSAPPAGSYTCNGDDTLLETYGIYQTHTQYGYFAASLAPIDGEFRLGYSIVDNHGNTTNFNPLLPLGPLLHLPIALGRYRNCCLQGRRFQGRLELLPVGGRVFCRPDGQPLLPCQQHDAGAKVRVLNIAFQIWRRNAVLRVSLVSRR